MGVISPYNPITWADHNKNYQMKFLLKGLLITNIILLSILYFLHSFERFSSYYDLSIISVFVFIIMSFGLFYVSKISINSTNKHLFISITLVNLFVKFMATGIILAGYYKYLQPKDTNFVLPYLIIYIAFTIFETVLILKVSDGKI